MSDAEATMCGNLTRDLELRFTAGGTAVANTAIAVNRRYKRNDEWVENTSFFDVKIWGELGENASESLHKGDRVLIAGRLEQESWTTEDGSKRSKVILVADEIGPSLRWATVDGLTKTHKTTNTSTPAPAAAAGGYDEEAF